MRLEQLIAAHPGEGSRMSAPARKRKAVEFMNAQHGVEPLGPPPKRLVTMYEPVVEGGVVVRHSSVNSGSNAGRFANVFAGFQIVDPGAEEAAGSGGEAAGSGGEAAGSTSGEAGGAGAADEEMDGGD